MQVINGVVVAKVDEVEGDPDGLGQIRLIFNWMSEGGTKTKWVRVAVPMSGPERGMQFMPEKGDEVLVAFEHGDAEHPYVIGYLWNGKSKAPVKEPSKRTIKTVSGHVLEFEDKEGSEKISLLFKGDKPSFTLKEDEAKIAFADNCTITLDNNGIRIEFGSSTIKLEQSEIKIKAGTIRLN